MTPRAIDALRRFIAEAAQSTAGKPAIHSITVTPDFLKRLSYETSLMDLRHDTSLKTTERKFMGVKIEVSE